MARRGRQGSVRQGRARRGWAWRGRAGRAWLGEARLGRAGQGRAGQARQGTAWPGGARRGGAGQAWLGGARHGGARRGAAWHGWARRGEAGQAWKLNEGEETEMTLPAVEVVGVPQEAAREIRQVYESTAGHAMPAAVLTVAKDPSSALHRYFEWDDSAAAEAHRLSQAENLVRRVRVKVIPADEQAKPINVRAYVSRRELPAKEESDVQPGGYLAIEDIASETDRQAALMQSIRRDVLRLQSKYVSVDEFARIVNEVLEGEAGP